MISPARRLQWPSRGTCASVCCAAIAAMAIGSCRTIEQHYHSFTRVDYGRVDHVLVIDNRADASDDRLVEFLSGRISEPELLPLPEAWALALMQKCGTKDYAIIGALTVELHADARDHRVFEAMERGARASGGDAVIVVLSGRRQVRTEVVTPGLADVNAMDELQARGELAPRVFLPPQRATSGYSTQIERMWVRGIVLRHIPGIEELRSTQPARPA